MNAHQHELRLTVELRQVPDAVACIFHSLFLHRTLAKFQFSSDNNYTLGSIGLKEEDCSHIDLTYVRLNSDELLEVLDEDVVKFRREVEEASFSGSAPRRTPSVGSPSESAVPLMSAQIGLDFYQKQRKSLVNSWMGGDDTVVWEQWKIVLDVFRVESIDELKRMRHTVADSLSDVVLNLCTKINKPLYTPKMPTRSQLGDVFDTRFSDCQPFLFRIKRQAVPKWRICSDPAIVELFAGDSLHQRRHVLMLSVPMGYPWINTNPKWATSKELFATDITF